MEISNLNDRDALFEYNISAGYPEPIVFDTERLCKINENLFGQYQNYLYFCIEISKLNKYGKNI